LPPVTVAVNVVDWLVVIEVAEAVSAVVLVNAVFHLVMRFEMFSVPKPVTWSNPGADAYATVSELAPVNDNMPYPYPAAVST
jgi:hypothetical protein